jgi:hypothetical protein
VDVRVTLPTPLDGTPLLLTGLNTNMPTFVHKIGALEESVEFQVVDMRTSYVPITVQVCLEPLDLQMTLITMTVQVDSC